MRTSETPRFPLLTEQQLAEILAVSTAALRRWRREGRGPRYVKVGRLVRYYSGAELAEWLAAREASLEGE